MAERTVGLKTGIIPSSTEIAQTLSGLEAQGLRNAAVRQQMSLADLKAIQGQKQAEQQAALNQLVLQQQQLGLASQLAGAGLADQARAVSPAFQNASLDQLAQAGITPQQRITNQQQEQRIGLERERLDTSKEQFDRSFELKKEQFAKQDERDMRDFLFKVEQADEQSKRFFATFQQNQFNNDRDYELNRARLILDSQARRGPQFNSEVGQILADMQAAEEAGNFEAVDALNNALKQEQRGQAFDIIKKGEQSRYETLAKNSDLALEQLANIKEMRSLLENVDTGLQNAVTLPINKALNAVGQVFGVDIGKDISDVEALNALFNKGVLNAAKLLTGPKSDKDIAFLKASVPSLLNTKEGNLILVDIMEDMAELQVAQEQYVSDQLTTGGSKTVAQAVKKWRDLNDGGILGAEQRDMIQQLRKGPKQGVSQLSDDDIKNQLGL